jgi:hypothetical protein
MLEELNQLAIDQIVYRLANPPAVGAALADLPVSLEDALDTLDLLELRSAEDATTLLETPFFEDPSYTPRPTRFSDSTWRVFYSALELETAEHERGHWCGKEAQPKPATLRRFHFRQLRCRVNGSGYDLRPKRMEWPFLTGDDTYPPCQALAKEAKAAAASTMLCPSARHENGTTTPVFVREVLSEPAILGVTILELSPSGEIDIIRC